VRLKEEEEHLHEEEAGRLRGKTEDEDEGQKVLEEAERLKDEEAQAGAEATSKDGEIAEAHVQEKPKDKEFLRIDTSTASPTSADQSRQ
jgi:hypothetical protein